MDIFVIICLDVGLLIMMFNTGTVLANITVNKDFLTGLQESYLYMIE